jgi:outer membrane immunogenic protein
MGLRTQAVAVVALLALAVQSAPTSADGLPGKPEDPYRYTPYDPAVPVFLTHDWSGFYIGGQLGWGYANAESTDIAPDPFTPQLLDALNYDQTGSRILGGAQAGWQRQWGRVVAGAEVAWASLRFDGSSISPVSALSPVFSSPVSRSVEVRDIFTLTGRLGYADDRMLAYVKAGWANADVSASYSLLSTGTVLSSSSGRENGWTAGVGADYALLPNLFVGIEYNYMNFKTGVVPPSIPNAQFGDVTLDVQTVVLRLNYRFGGPRP